MKIEISMQLRPCIDEITDENLLFHCWVYGNIALCEREDGTMTERGRDRIKFLDSKHKEYNFLYEKQRKEDEGKWA